MTIQFAGSNAEFDVVEDMAVIVLPDGREVFDSGMKATGVPDDGAVVLDGHDAYTITDSVVMVYRADYSDDWEATSYNWGDVVTFTRGNLTEAWDY